MLGVSLSFYKKPLKSVPAHISRNPIKSVNLREIIREDSEYLEGKDIVLHAYRVPLRDYKKVDMEIICKIRFSSIIMMDPSVEKLFEEDLNYTLVRKISSSMWRWSGGRPDWNNIVSAYNIIRAFEFHPNFSVRLDYSTWFNEKGYSEHTRTYLDGALAFLIYYKNEHVMTIGFSVMSGRRILLQQVQLKKPKGNRWLFKLPNNYLEYVIDLFFKTFQKYRIYLVDGNDIVDKYITDFTYTAMKAEDKEYLKELIEHIDHLKRDKPRLVAFYANTGKYAKVPSKLKFSGVAYHKLEQVNA